jgi:hypothetical protein
MAESTIWILSPSERAIAGKQRIMRAPEHERIHPIGRHRIEITLNRQISQFIVEQSFFDQRHKQRAGDARDPDMNIECAQRILICAAANGRARANDTDVTIARHRDGGVRAWLDHARSPEPKVRAQLRNRD